MLAFILFHVVTLHRWFGGRFDPNNAFSSASHAIWQFWHGLPAGHPGNLLFAQFYLLGIVAAVYHLTNGVATGAEVLGCVNTPAAQERLWRICLIAAPALLLAGLAVWRAIANRRLTRIQAGDRHTDPTVSGRQSPGYVICSRNFAAGPRRLADFDRIWLIYFFHRAAVAKMSIVPYRDTVEHGLFATRAPARPNALGISCVRLLNIEGCILRLAEVDVLDGTPCSTSSLTFRNTTIIRCNAAGWLDTVPDKPVVADARFERKTPW